MKKLFVHNPLFRILSPIFSGVLVYLLILLINNNIEQLQDSFLGEELYFCIGLSYLTQELARLLLLFIGKVGIGSGWSTLIVKILGALALTIAVVITAVYIYYQKILGYSPSLTEIWTFVGIYSVIMLIYVSLYLSHQFLFEVNTQRIQEELDQKAAIQADFIQFQRGINPDLLFESFDSLILLIRKDRDQAENFIDQLAVVYRYILSRKREELVPLATELEPLTELVALFNELPYRTLKLDIPDEISSYVLPGSLLAIIEKIVRTTIAAPDLLLNIRLAEEKEHLTLVYESHEKVTESLTLSDLIMIQESYALYTDEQVFVQQLDAEKIIGLPKITLQEQVV